MNRSKRYAVIALSLAALVSCKGAEPTPMPSPIPTATFAPATSPTVTPTAVAYGTPQPRLFVVVALRPENVQGGSKITATVDTLPSTLCAIQVTDPVGQRFSVSPPNGLAGADGRFSWSWTVPKGGAGVSTWHASAECLQNLTKVSAKEPFKVYG